MIGKSSHDSEGTVQWVRSASTSSVVPSVKNRSTRDEGRGKQENTHAHFGTCNNTCCAISVSGFAPTADDEDAAAAAVDAEAAADVVDSGTVGGIVPMG